ncbi:MAG: class I adenylate-forming enzyme family protein [Rhodococcus sp. (in: high G+C Gram-positive bacteria)]|uniref:class I adenylate-forming enzyme family protein n=1 Tax=Rhodococcus sp. TaxID=1831 RepID=UPI003BB1E070
MSNSTFPTTQPRPPHAVDPLGVLDNDPNLWEVFSTYLSATPDADAIIHGDNRITYRELGRIVNLTCNALTSRRVVKGDRIAVLSYPRPEVVALFLACARLGAVFVALGTRAQEPELDYVFSDARPKVVFSVREFEGRRYDDMAALVAARHGAQPPIILGSLRADGLAPEFDDFLRGPIDREEATLDQSPVPAGMPLSIVYTSGTTGKPKGAVLSQRGLLSFHALVRNRPIVAPRILSVMPIDHVGGQGNEMTTAFLTGGALVQLPRFDARAVLTAIEKERVTLWQGVIPTMLNRIVALPEFESADLSSLQRLWWAGPFSRRVAEKIASRVPEVGSSYGMSEVGSITMTAVGDNLSTLIESVGRPLDDVELRVLAEDGEVGEILVRRPAMMVGYYGMAEATAEAIDDEGWLHTGDLGRIDTDGNLHLTGRSKLLIRSGGYNLSPMEIETVIAGHPDVRDVIVVGVPDPNFGEAAHALVVTRVDHPVSDRDLRQHLGASLPNYKIPKNFFRTVEIPLLANGKHNRVKCRELVLTLLNSTEN